MTTTKWTAGEWRIEQSKRDYFNIVSGDEHIAKVISTCRPGCEGADAQLIALSPEWPEVLERLIELFPDGADSPEPHHPINLARALLARLPK